MYRTTQLAFRVVLLVSCVAWPQLAAAVPTRSAIPFQSPRLKIFLDCDRCYRDYLRAEVAFVDYVRDREEADVHVLITSIETGAGGREYTASFVGLSRFRGVDHSLTAVTTSSDPEDVVRRQLATTLRVGLLYYATRAGVPQHFEVGVALNQTQHAGPAAIDRWDNWVFSVRGFAEVEGEESSRELELGGALSADRVTPEWKITIGAFLEHTRQEFELDEDDDGEQPVTVERRRRELSGLTVNALDDHWSIGAGGELRSSTFNNTALGVDAFGAVEFNLFPYSAYTQRQLRTLYALGVRHALYNEETLFGYLQETRPRHELSVTFDRRERWGSLQARGELSQYLHDAAKYRLETAGEVSWRIVRGLSVSAQGSASRIRDQIALPRRGATPEEILLRQRQLRSGYDFDFRMSLTYTFGSIYSAIVNPRFGS